MAACSIAGERPPEGSVEKPQEGTQQKQEASPQAAKVSEPFDLGGPCLPLQYGVVQSRPIADKDELIANGKCDEVIELAKESVRGDCSIPYRWYELFTILIRGHRYREAVQVAAEVSARGIPFPHAILSNADPLFLDSDEFRSSAVGADYA